MAYLNSSSEIPTKGRGSKLTGKQLRFVEEYMIDLNGSKAVLRAGYVTHNENRIATELLQHPLVKREIESRLAGRRERMELSADYVITKLIAIVEETENGNPQAALRGLELLGKHLGLYRDRQEISGPDGGAIEMEQRVQEDVADFTSKLSRLAKQQGTGDVLEFPKRGGKSGS